MVHIHSTFLGTVIKNTYTLHKEL